MIQVSAVGATTSGEATTSLEAHLRARRAAGHKLLVPYVTAGITDEWLDVVEAVIGAGADAVEVGLPFSDPAVDGPTIQQASQVALDRGTSPLGALGELAGRRVGVPLVAMTYYNLVLRSGHERFAASLASAGVSGAIIPDLPPELGEPWRTAAEAHGIDNVLLVAPVTSDARLELLAGRTAGFLYSVSTMGTTGERTSLDEAAGVLARRVKAVSDVPVLIGFGISTPEHAVAACEAADGVIVASALMRRLLDGGDAADVAALVAQMRDALDAG